MAKKKTGVGSASAEGTPLARNQKRPGRLILVVGEPVSGSIEVTVEIKTESRTGSKYGYSVTAVFGILLGVALTMTAYHTAAHGKVDVVRAILQFARELIKFLGG